MRGYPPWRATSSCLILSSTSLALVNVPRTHVWPLIHWVWFPAFFLVSFLYPKSDMKRIEHFLTTYRQWQCKSAIMLFTLYVYSRLSWSIEDFLVVLVSWQPLAVLLLGSNYLMTSQAFFEPSVLFNPLDSSYLLLWLSGTGSWVFF